MATISVILGSVAKSRVDARIFQREEDRNACILTIETRCDLSEGHIFDLSTIQFHGTFEELHDLCGVIQAAVDKLLIPQEPADENERCYPDNHSALFAATDIEESLKGPQF
jgi:hypothetical protein